MSRGARRRPSRVVVCAEPGCAVLVSGGSYCASHARDPWPNRQERRTNRKSGWDEQRLHKGVLARDGRICHVCGGYGANEVDHVVPVAEGGTSDPSNLRPIHAEPCHKAKTAEESARARHRRAERVTVELPATDEVEG